MASALLDSCLEHPTASVLKHKDAKRIATSMSPFAKKRKVVSEVPVKSGQTNGGNGFDETLLQQEFGDFSKLIDGGGDCQNYDQPQLVTVLLIIHRFKNHGQSPDHQHETLPDWFFWSQPVDSSKRTTVDSRKKYVLAHVARYSPEAVGQLRELMVQDDTRGQPTRTTVFELLFDPQKQLFFVPDSDGQGFPLEFVFDCWSGTHPLKTAFLHGMDLDNEKHTAFFKKYLDQRCSNEENSDRAFVINHCDHPVVKDVCLNYVLKDKKIFSFDLPFTMVFLQLSDYKYLLRKNAYVLDMCNHGIN